MNENNRTVVKLPKEYALPYHDILLSNNPKFGADLDDLISLQEDYFAEYPTNEFQGIDTRLRKLK